jgi:sporulation protein YqfC
MKVIFRFDYMDNIISKVKENLAEKLDIPRDVILKYPKITVIGNNEITIENHKGIIAFKEDNIKVKSTIGTVNIKGMNLEILYISNVTIVLSGRFIAIEYEENSSEH